jgi:peptidoglycan/xylan/chitin deacetylase (PgdA/CDA1 family)
MQRWSGVLTLNYHRIGDGSKSVFDRGLWSAGVEEFSDQLRFCKGELDLIGPDQLERALSAPSGRYGLITFDDGYRDNYEIAFPILRQQRVPATFFVTTGFIDDRRLAWWDEIAWIVRSSRQSRIESSRWLPTPVVFDEPSRERAVGALLHAYKLLPSAETSEYLDAVAAAAGTGRCQLPLGGEWMTWEMLRKMRDAGMTIGGHSVTHPVLARANRERQQWEIAECAKRLKFELGEPMRYFAYPVGSATAFNQVTRDCLREAGVQFAFSYYGGFRTFSDWDDLDVRRVAIEVEITPDWFRAIVVLPRLFA